LEIIQQWLIQIQTVPGRHEVHVPGAAALDQRRDDDDLALVVGSNRLLVDLLAKHLGRLVVHLAHPHLAPHRLGLR